MNANEEVEHYTELAQIALTWIQTNNNPDEAAREHDQQLLYQIYGKGAVMTGFQIALAMLLQHGAQIEHRTMDDHIGCTRQILNSMKTDYKTRLGA